MDRDFTKSLSYGAIVYLIHHVFLPPKLPQEDDSNSEYESITLRITLDTLHKFKKYVADDQNDTIDSIIFMVTSLLKTHDSFDSTDDGCERKLEDVLRDLCKQGKDFLPDAFKPSHRVELVKRRTALLHIRAQNAGVMASKVENSIHIEVFELSPLNQPVITTKGRLRRSFPGPALSLNVDTFEQPEFLGTVAYTLAKMSYQPAIGTKPKVRKAGREHDENRDTTHPSILTELFIAFLRPVAEPVDVSRVWKNTREEVMWLDSLLPWRRSPVWLLVRVAMQLVFSRLGEPSASSGDLYKTFMVVLMSHVLELSHQHHLPSDLLHAMNAKLARRLLKFIPAIDENVFDFAQNVMQRTHRLLCKRWSNVMKEASLCLDFTQLKHLDFRQDAYNNLVTLEEYVKSLGKRRRHKSGLSFQPTPILVKYEAKELPSCSESPTTYIVYDLKALEDWVASSLHQWLEARKGNDGTCEQLGDLIQKYHGVAVPLYSGNPEASSIMLLTILELWIACDKSATHICGFLEDYDAGIPSELFQSLVLPFKSQMERLLRAESYLKHRGARANHQSPSIFKDYGLPSCFSVRYFTQSSEHRMLLQKIDNQAAQTRQEKRNEFHQKKDEYRSLMRLHDQIMCEYDTIIVDSYNGFQEQRHNRFCKKCHYESQATSLDIEVHEWPLPENRLEAQSTVFELRVPPFFGQWRDTTMFLLLDVLSIEYLSTDLPRSSHPLHSYEGLSSFFTPFSEKQRLGLLSENKPHAVTHRRNKSIAVTTEDDVCLNNGLRYQYYDGKTGGFVNSLHVSDKISNLLTYKFPIQSSALQRFLYRPAAMPDGLSPNTVIASQSDCPAHMSMDEYKALCTIPLGNRIQWKNVLLQLSVPLVDFQKSETTFVVLQTIYQVGPSSDGDTLRIGHKVAAEEYFAAALLGSLHEASQRIGKNWESSKALSTFISLARRLLSLTAAEDIQKRCLVYLAGVRAVTFSWVNLLRKKAHRAALDRYRADIISRAVEIALICVDSFNVDKKYLDEALALPEDASIFIQCSIFIQESNYRISKTSDPMISLLHWRWQRLSYRCHHSLPQGILEAPGRSLDKAIKNSWSAYQAGDGWRAFSERVDYWLVSQTAPQLNSEPLWVQYNLLTGELLVNGVPLARLPPEYEKHPTHCTLFGHSALEVMPTVVSGMRFSGKREHAGYTLHFGLSQTPGILDPPGYDLLVQAVKDERRYELIPSRYFRGEFPTAFVEDFVHWYDMNDDCLEFRPLEDPWTSSPSNWRMIKANPNAHWRLEKDGMSLVSVKSKTATLLSGILSPLEDPLRIHIVLRHSSSSLEIELPRLQLGFRLKSGASSIQSQQFRGMIIDKHQSLDALVGLRNKLMLKHENNDSRLVILPEGPVSYQKNSDHVHVSIDKSSAAKAHAYNVDKQIGRLVDNGSFQSKLFLSYLLALTSYCLPDPLTQRTGTEEALSILQSGAVRSFDRLAQENIDILYQIAHLTPGRSYYPTNERVMQTVKWDPEISFLAQHGGFYHSVKLIFDEAEKGKIFYPDSYLNPRPLDHIEPTLLHRDCIRSSTLRVSGFGAEDHTIEHDTVYSARDRRQNSAQGFRAFVISSLVYNGRPALHYDVPSDFRAHLWGFLADIDEISGPSNLIPSSELKYDAGLLEESTEIVSKYWNSFQQTFDRTCPRVDKFRLMIWLSTLAFATECDIMIVQTLASFSVLPEMARITPPAIASFRLSQGTAVEVWILRHLIRSALLPFRLCPEAAIERHFRESAYEYQRRQQRQFQSNQDKAIDKLMSALEAQWPCEVPTTPGDVELCTYIDMRKMVEITRPKFKVWFDNHRFYNYLGQVEGVLCLSTINPLEMPLYSLITPAWDFRKERGFVSIDDIFVCSPPPTLPNGTRNLAENLLESTGEKKTVHRLTCLIDRIDDQARFNHEKNYANDLRASLYSLRSWETEYHLKSEGDGVEKILHDHLSHCKERVHIDYASISSALILGKAAANLPSKRRHRSSTVIADIQQWPRLSPVLFLQQLTRGRWQQITDDWKRCLVHYALAIAELQRAERLVSLSRCHADLIAELQNAGHTNWDPAEHPESLLLEVESGIMIREVQEQIAREMKDPQPARNAVMQLNMGEGKSSVIVPMVAAALVDGSTLVRVIVAKPQSKQLFQMLVSKLGGLLNRRVCHLPFSRSLKLDEAKANAIGIMCREFMTNGDVLLVQPEHLLSFKLMGLESLITGKDEIGRSLLRTQKFFDESTRDIVDESDENFSVKFELIYTMGMQRPVELSPERWICVQQVLDLVKIFAPSVNKEFPLSMEVIERLPGSFPRTRFLRLDAQQRIFECVARRLCETGLTGLPIARQSATVRQAVYRYITVVDVAEGESQAAGRFGEMAQNILLLLRGLFAGGVLAFVFSQKRWRVNYGLVANRQPRTNLAVPYRAKDSPTPRSEFSHPDVVIVLTSLSYYYGGLDDDSLFLTFTHLLRSDQASIEYQGWVKDGPGLPLAFRQLIGINLKDRFQCIEQVFPPLRYAKSVIDYWLAKIVFPKEMKEFPHKLSASGWDIGQIKAYPTTGFSGTNDSRKTLPLSVEQIDLPEQNHTNALVLDYLLRPENTVALMPREETSSSDAQFLLAMVTKMNPPPQVILDVGAQILELSNMEVAQRWLEMMPNHGQAEAVVFFDDSDELSVLDRKGRIEPLQTSSFAKQLDICLVFLDEAHTRGTDLRLPKYYKAAVTLGANLTKDRLVQACMRMRKLGKGQSIVFCVPEEIKIKILTQTGKPDDAVIDVADVLCWAISETCIELRRSMPLWAVQGQRHEYQNTLWADARTDGEIDLSKARAEQFLEKESQTLEDRYRPRTSTDVTSSSQGRRNENFELIVKRCREFGTLEVASAKLQEEQERELSPEIEQESQVQKPAPIQPAEHIIHPDLTTFIKWGKLIAGSKAYEPAFQTLRNTSAVAYLDVAQFPCDLLVTADFARTVQISGKSYIPDDYQRPVQWILTSTGSSDPSENPIKHAVIISPFEAHQLQSSIESSQAVMLHLYAPRPNLGFRSLDGLDLYTVPACQWARKVPRRLVILLNLFAGQLYLGSFREYAEVCDLLGLAWEQTAEGRVVDADGFISRDDAGLGVSDYKSGFSCSPVSFLNVLMTKIRRNCEGISKTHMGRILDGQILRRSDFGEPEDET